MREESTMVTGIVRPVDFTGRRSHEGGGIIFKNGGSLEVDTFFSYLRLLNLRMVLPIVEVVE
jgi:hypothetical protein